MYYLYSDRVRSDHSVSISQLIYPFLASDGVAINEMVLLSKNNHLICGHHQVTPIPYHP